MTDSLKKLKNDNITENPQKNAKKNLNRDVWYFEDYKEKMTTIEAWVVLEDNINLPKYSQLTKSCLYVIISDK